jgi:flagellar biosynthesis/type III secretory pathway M-ring protein FliF/YscJ
MILVAVTGVLSVYTAVYITKSPFFTGSDKADIPQLQKAYTNSIISASLCLGALGLLIIGFVTYFFVSRQRKKKADAAARKGSEIEVQKRELLKTAKEAELREKLQHQKELRDRITKASEDALVERISHNTAYPPPPVLTPAST